MQGLHVINDINGNPAVLTIDLHNLDPDVNPLVTELLDLLRQQDEQQEDADHRAAAHTTLNQPYGTNEPDYSNVAALPSASINRE